MFNRPIQGNYGIDAPYVPIMFLSITIILTVFAVVFDAVWLYIIAIYLFMNFMLYMHTTLRGKFVVWKNLLSNHGPQKINFACDIACGRGMVLLQIAKRHPEAKIYGLDLWNKLDQSGNSPEVTQENAKLNDLNNIELETGNMLSIPFQDNQFDLVTSSIAIHSLKNKADREKVISEIYRITKPGGTIILVDFQHTKEYQESLKNLTHSPVIRNRCGFNGWFGNPVYGCHSVMTKK